MRKVKDKIQILKQLDASFKKNIFTDINLDNILKKEKIEATKFYTLFPHKTKSLCCFFFENIGNCVENNIKKNIRNEKSVSKRVKYLLIYILIFYFRSYKILFFFLYYF